MDACRRSQTIWRTLRPRPLGRCCGWPPINTLYFPTCIILPLRRCRSKPFGRRYGSPKNLRTLRPRLLGTGAGLTPYKHVTPPPCYHAKFRHAKVKLYDRNYGDPPENWSVARHLSRSFKFIETDTARSATYDFLLVIIEAMGLYRTVSVITSDDCNILPVRVFNVPRGGSPWNFVTALGSKKLEWCPYQIARIC